MEMPERREYPRSSLAMPVQLRRFIHNQSAVIRDLSSTGCRVETSDTPLDPGNRLLIRPEGFDSLLGTVIWSRGEQAGVQFDEALPHALVDRYCRLFPDPDTSVLIDIAA